MKEYETVKSEPKPFASLSSGLLARKGAAKPAMRPQGFGQGAASLEDLGWNDMGFEPPRAATPVRDEGHDAFGMAHGEQPLRNPLAALTPILSPVHHQQAEIAGWLDAGGEQADEWEAAAQDRAEDEVGDQVRADFNDEAEDDIEELELTVELQELDEAEIADAALRVAEAAPEFAAVPAVRAASKPPRKSVEPRSAAMGKAKAAFTLRLEPARHLKLRLACAVSGRSAQLLVTDALDRLLAGMPELDAMAASANRKG